ncbi:DUF1129 family protein [Ectobacillus polymachus]|uniref:DUF1129 family protein n=1 Tax=Ectobacillus polymachus TaxID=1508806 RepID=UPI003A8AE89D
MLSKKSEQFLVELRMYLISKGKNDNEINEITEELEVHLLEAEAQGKDVSHIIGNSPKQYMKSIGKSMNTDFRQLVVLIPMMLLLFVAFLCFGPAIEGKFSLSNSIIWTMLLTICVSFLIYGLLLFKVLPKFFQSKWGYILAFGAFVLVTGLDVVITLWFHKQGAEATFNATPFQNNLIVLLCIVIFIGSAIYTKSWFLILIPLFNSLGPLATRFIPEEINRNPTYVFYTTLFLLIITAFVIVIFIRKRKSSTIKRS